MSLEYYDEDEIGDGEVEVEVDNEGGLASM
jgi:hypothetical protein